MAIAVDHFSTQHKSFGMKAIGAYVVREGLSCSVRVAYTRERSMEKK